MNRPCAILIVTATITGHLSKVYQAMGYGALDAIDTPTLGPRGEISGAAVLLHKIELIGKLLGKPAETSSGRAQKAGLTHRADLCRSALTGRSILSLSWAPRPVARRRLRCCFRGFPPRSRPA